MGDAPEESTTSPASERAETRTPGRQRGPRSGDRPELASIIVCVFNRAQQIRQCLDSIVHLQQVKFEIIVVDDGSTDATPQVLQDFKQAHGAFSMRVVRQSLNRGISAARNVGLTEAHGRHILFTDSDCLVHPDWATHLVRALNLPGIVAAAGSVIEPPPRNIAERAFHGTTRIGRGVGQSRDLVGNNMGFRREILQQFVFDEALNYGCDEDDLARRLRNCGYRIAFVPEAIVAHDHFLDSARYVRMAVRQGVGSARYWYKHGAYIGRDLVALAGAIITLPLGLISPGLLAIPGLLLALQLFAMGFAEMAYKGKGTLETLRVLPVQCLYILFKGWGVLTTWGRLLRGKETAIQASKKTWLAETRSGK